MFGDTVRIWLAQRKRNNTDAPKEIEHAVAPDIPPQQLTRAEQARINGRLSKGRPRKVQCAGTVQAQVAHTAMQPFTLSASIETPIQSAITPEPAPLDIAGLIHAGPLAAPEAWRGCMPEIELAEPAPTPTSETIVEAEDTTVKMTQAQLQAVLATAVKDAITEYAASHPQTVAAPRMLTPGEAVVAVPAEPEQMPADVLIDDLRTDQLVRSSAQIASLIKWGETAEQRERRIENDRQRYSRQRAGRKSVNPQEAISNVSHGTKSEWVRR